MARALLSGPPPGPDSSNETNHGPNRACTKQNDPRKEGARAVLKRAAHGVLLLADGSPDFSHKWATSSLP
ncbi:hypothetical protein F511_22461 [Dorcoceras hygrometricum]|uniref:Uncharacterized protein n=1 Tax=Dorcoceras hygrometricum TaxID=472368 RepID=A0A2Z7D5Y8_9LAMI|nr:hypothetical protein F511_22461 [Dorcoceras hygrometricum]